MPRALVDVALDRRSSFTLELAQPRRKLAQRAAAVSDFGFLQRIELGDGITRYEPADQSGHHHHHVVCGSCGKVDAFEDDRLEQALRRVERRTGYAVAAHEVVLRGTCRDCG